MIDRAEPNLTTTQLYSTENHYPPRVSVAPSRPSSFPLVTGRSVSAVGMSCSGSPCAPLHTLHRCGGSHSRGRCNTHHSTRNMSCCHVLFVLLAPLYSCSSGHHSWCSLSWMPGLLLPEPTRIWRISGQSPGNAGTSCHVLGEGIAPAPLRTVVRQWSCTLVASNARRGSCAYVCACVHNTHHYHTFGLLTGLNFIS